MHALQKGSGVRAGLARWGLAVEEQDGSGQEGSRGPGLGVSVNSRERRGHPRTTRNCSVLRVALPAGWAGLTACSQDQLPAGKPPGELLRMQTPGSLSQACLISIFGIQAQEHGFPWVILRQRKPQTHCSGHIVQIPTGEPRGSQCLAVAGSPRRRRGPRDPHWHQYAPGSSPKWV